MLDPRTPVLVGVGTVTEHGDDPSQLGEPLALMITAARAAADDAAAPDLPARAGLVLVPKGIWDYADPGRAVAAAVGAAARSVLAEVGILQQTLIGRACAAIAAGDADVALVLGAEARNRARLAARAAVEAPESDAPGPPDELLLPEGEIVTAVEIERDLAVPAHQYALVESALRHLDGVSAADQRARLGRLWAGFAEVAAGCPTAWDRSAPSADEITAPGPANRMIASPYTRLLCSQWNVDQGVALLITSVEAARAAGVPDDRWVFPVAAAESQAMIPLPARADVHRSPATAAAGRALRDRTGLAPDQVDHLDLYSCFPAAVQVQARELGIALDREAGPALTVTGGMTFGGGPLNSYVLHATATMARVLRADPGSTGLVTAVSGMLTKPALALWSTTPPGAPFATDDVTAQALADTATRPIDPEATGRATVVGHTVVHDAGEPSRTAALIETADGRRSIAVDRDRARAADAVEADLVGSAVELRAPGVLA